MKKCEILELMRDLPEDLEVDKFIYTLWFRRKIEHAVAEAEKDEGIPHEEIIKRGEEWFR